MRIEIKSAANFLVDLARLNNNRLNEDQLSKFRDHVCEILQRHYKDHWFPDRPFKGSGYRCIRINGQLDPLIARAGFIMGLTVSYLRSLFPSELTMWVDPMEVAYRIGENGSICVLYEENKKAAEAIVKTTPVKMMPPPAAPPAVAPSSAPSSSPPPTSLHQQHQLQQIHSHHHHFSPSKSMVVSSPLHQSPPMSPAAQQHAAATAMQLFLMGAKEVAHGSSNSLKCKESLRGGLDPRPLQMDRLFVSS